MSAGVHAAIARHSNKKRSIIFIKYLISKLSISNIEIILKRFQKVIGLWKKAAFHTVQEEKRAHTTRCDLFYSDIQALWKLVEL